MKKLLVATRKGLFAAMPSATTSLPASADDWALSPIGFVGEPVSMALHDPRDGALYAALNLGHFGVKLHRSSDGGATWSEIAAPAFPPQSAAEAKAEAEWPKASPWSLVQFWCLEAGGADEPGVLWAGTIPGGLFRSADRGASWELVRSLWDRPERRHWMGGGYDHPGIHSICVDSRDARHVTVGVSCGGVWVTRDGGGSWKLKADGMFAAYMPEGRQHDPSIQDPHRLDSCNAAPDVLWAQHHNGVFRSIDGSASWQEVPDVKPSVFGFAVAAHPKEPGTAWFVPAVKDECRVPVNGELVVSRTRDGGKSFEVLRNGLPVGKAYDLVYRHGLAVDASGTHLAMGSTTGGLWLSANEGDSWRLLSAHLPPVYAVRFAD
ncbi:MAG: exo-alpha-sialidase [Thermoanaerobaculia bacterium]